MGTQTPNLGLKKPTVGVSTSWPEDWNNNADLVDAAITANTDQIVTTSGFLQSEIDAGGGGGGAGVQSLNSLTNAVTIEGKENAVVTTEGQNVVVSGSRNPTFDNVTNKLALDFDSVTAPGSLTAVAGNADSNMPSGFFAYFVSFVTAIGETEVGPSAFASSGSPGDFNLSNIPVSSDERVIGRRIFRANFAGPMGLVVQIDDNVTTTFIDAVPDNALVDAGDFQHQDNSTLKGITLKGAPFVFFSVKDNVTLGRNAGTALIAGGLTSNNTLIGGNAGNQITTGLNNTLVGVNSGHSITTGSNNTALGGTNLLVLTIGTNNVAIGSNNSNHIIQGNSNVSIGAGAGSRTNALSQSNNVYIGANSGGDGFNADNNIFIGNEAGNKQIDAVNRLIIDSLSRTDSNAELTQSIIVGTIDANPANQTLTFNASLDVTEGYKANGTPGASGSFSSADGKTVTVTNGLITGIV